MKPETMTTEEVMQLFHVSQRTVYRWIERGRLQGVRVGRRWIFDRAKVYALLKAEK